MTVLSALPDQQTVHAPAKSIDNKIPQGVSARCRDGSYSFSKKHRGTCSRHGGVVTGFSHAENFCSQCLN
ncbi:DUF3761 domain-containing protein [Undibacterium sp. 14-3-2]|nr:DUF3761 domain-containing protein [Undibacterium sp. 14-3-2]